MLTYFLPELRKEFDDPVEAGQWMRSSRLDAMAGALEISSSQVEIDGLKSLPDPWARPLLFGQALTSESHVAKADGRQQWRGLLALIALQHFYSKSYALDVLVTDLEDKSRGNPRLREVLKVLAPNESLSPDLDWTRTGVITIQPTGNDRFQAGDHKSIGLLVPNCLVAPSRAARQVSIEGVPWLQKGLKDPTEVAELPVKEWEALHDYLGQVFEHLNTPQISHRGASLRAELRAFAEAVDRKIQEAGATDVAFSYDDPNRGLPHSFYGPVFTAPQKPEDDFELVSECLLEMQSGLSLTTMNTGVNGFVLLDHDIASNTIRKSEQNISFWKSTMLGSLGQRGAFSAVEEDVRREGYLVVTPDDLMTSKLTRLVNNGRVKMHSPEWENFLLPISPLVLFLLQRDEINEKLKIQDRGDHYLVRLEVAIKSSAAGARAHKHVIERQYSKSEDVIEEAASDDIITWPDVGNSKWPWNFLRMSHNPVLQLAPRFAASAASLSEIIRKRSNQKSEQALDLMRVMGSNQDTVFEHQDDFFSGESAELKGLDNKLIAHRFRFNDQTEGVGEQHLMAQGAEALFFAADPDGDGVTIPAGCMMMPELRWDQRPGKVEISVDFGTTNTVVYMKTGDKVGRMEFQSRVSQPLTLRSASDDQFAEDCVEFMPSSKVISPFPTVMFLRRFQLRGDNPAQSKSNSSYHGVGDNIFFMPELPDKFAKAISYQEKQQLKFGLKWSPELEMKAMVQRFLRQIILMSAVEVMANNNTLEDINWHFSYPQAWSKPQATSFHSLVKQAWRDVFEPIFGKTVSPDSAIEFETEGAAALRYFTEGPGNAGQAGSLILMFDIGGGTTEIAIFKDDRTIWRSSFRIAGGDFFTSFMSSNLGIFDFIQDRESGASSFREAMEKHDIKSPDRNFVELYISQQSFDESFEQSYTLFSDEEEGRALRDCAMTALGGLFYYSGLVLHKCIEEGLLSESDVDDLTLAFAGRGATFFRYLGDASDPETELGSLSRIITDVVHSRVATQSETSNSYDDGDNWDDEEEGGYVTALFSPAPKHEVACGMLYGERQKRKKVRLQATPLGEVIKIRDNRELRDLSADFIVEDLPAGASLEGVGTDEFDKFIAAFDKRTGIQIDLDAKGGKAKRELNNTARREMTKAMRDMEPAEKDGPRGETLDFEPPFITRLRVLVEILADEMATKSSKLTVHHRDDSSW